MGAYFAFDDSGIMIDKTCFMLISNDAKYLQATLSSKLFEYAYKQIFSSVELGNHGYQYNKHALVKVPIALKTWEKDKEYTNNFIYSLYNISKEEKEFIEFQQIRY